MEEDQEAVQRGHSVAALGLGLDPQLDQMPGKLAEALAAALASHEAGGKLQLFPKSSDVGDSKGMWKKFPHRFIIG